MTQEVIFQGPAVWQGEDTVRVNAWFEDDGSATLVIESSEDSGDDVHVTIPATSVGLDLREKLGHTPHITTRIVPPGTYARGANAHRAKRSRES